MQVIDYQTLREDMSRLSDVELKYLGSLVRGIVAADPNHAQVQALNEVIELMSREWMNRLQIALIHWRAKPFVPSTNPVLTHALRGLSDSELEEYSRATLDAMIRSTNDFEKTRHRENHRICLSIMCARAATQRMISCLSTVGTEIDPKVKPWSGEDG